MDQEGLGAVERVRSDHPLDTAIAEAFERVRDVDASACALVFDVAWQPTMDVVELVVRELETSPEVRTLTLIHPSAAMAFIATAVAAAASAEIRSQRSVHDEPELPHTDATASKTVFLMRADEALDAFVRRAVGEVRKRVSRRFALVFDAKSMPTLDLAGTLAEELLQCRVEEVGLIHPTQPLDAVVAALRLQLPGVRVAHGAEPRKS